MEKIKKKRCKKGTVVIETAIALPAFFFMFLAIYGLFVVFLARNEVRHALTQTAKSLSMDSYVLEKVDTTGEGGNAIANSFTEVATMFIRWITTDDYFSARTKWYQSDNSSTGQGIIRDRFIGFVSGGDETEANKYLKNLRVKDGVDGFTFEYHITDGVMTLQVDYTVEFWFHLFGLEDIPMSETYTVKMWGYS